MSNKDFTNRWAKGAASGASHGGDFTAGPTAPKRRKPIVSGPKPSALTGDFSPRIKPVDRKLTVGPKK